MGVGFAVLALALVALWFAVAALRGADGGSLRNDALLLIGPLFVIALVAVGGWWAALRARARQAEHTEAAKTDAIAARERADAARRRADAAAGAQREERERREHAERAEEEEARRRAEAEHAYEGEAQRREEAEQTHEGERRRRERAVEAREEALEEARRRLAALERSRRAERAWNRELTLQIDRLHAERRGGDADGAPSLVLRATMDLLDARRGVLLTHRDDGPLESKAAEGFDRDDERSAVVERFARRTLASDEIVREDDLIAIPVYLLDSFHGAVVLFDRPGGFAELDDETLLVVGDQAGAALNADRLRAELADAQWSAVRMLSEAIDAKDPLVGANTSELVSHVRLLAERLELDPSERQRLLCAALVRDVGTLGVSERILLKPGPLEPEERDVVELHPRIGFDVLTPMPALRDVATMVLHHHERYDGSGYPSGLSGDAIPLGARVLAVVDAFHAMTHDRPHRLAGSPAHAVEELVAGAGAQFDPELVQFFVEELRRREPRDALDGDDEDRRSAVVVRAGRPLLGEDLASLTDALTLLPNHRAFHEAAQAAAGRGGPFAVVLVEIESLADVNARDGYPAGDRVIQLAGRAAARVAHRHGATAYRDSGRRLGLLAPDGDQTVAAGLLADLRAEYASAPAVRLVAVTSEPGEGGESVIARARLRFGLDASLGRPEPR